MITKRIQLEIDTKVKKKLKPRGKPFVAGDPRTTPWVKGKSPNPSGRPKGSGKPSVRISTAYVVRLEQKASVEVTDAVAMRYHVAPELLRGYTHAELIGFSQAMEAGLGNTAAAKEVREATEGKVPDKVQMSDADGQPLSQPVLNIQFVKPGTDD